MATHRGVDFLQIARSTADGEETRMASSTQPNDTIIAPATPLGRGALAMVRMDGPRAWPILEDLSGGRSYEPRVATHVVLSDGTERIDDAVVVVYAGPKSYTGNDLVEVTLHGSPYIVSRFVEAATARGARIAEPGEFTERAVLNGKLDLVQAEAIGDLIASRTEVQARLSLAHLEGDLSRLAEQVRGRLLEVIARLEASLDFSDEGYEFIDRSEAGEVVSAARETIRELAATYRRGHATTEGLHAVLLGRPNAGKSTMLNFLCGSDRAIVTPVPGTTRDLLRETIEIGGLPVTLVDTAGLRGGAEEIEEIGIERARDAARGADLVLYLIDAVEGRTAEDDREIEAVRGAMVIFTKVDLAEAPAGAVGVSVPGRIGLDALLRGLDSRVRDSFAVPEGTAAIVNQRQRDAVERCGEAIQSAIESLEAGMNEEIVVVDLRRAAAELGRLVGAISNDEILDEIFSKFCIGK